MVFQPVGHLLGNALDAALLKGNFQPGSLQQLGVAGRTGAAHKAQIARPCILVVGQAQQEELQRGHGGQAVVDIIEGALINVQLALPAGTPAIEGQIVKIDPRAVFLFQLEPLGIAFIGGQVRILVHDVLELVHLTAVGKEHEAVLGVQQAPVHHRIAHKHNQKKREDLFCKDQTDHTSHVPFLLLQISPAGAVLQTTIIRRLRKSKRKCGFLNDIFAN